MSTNMYYYYIFATASAEVCYHIGQNKNEKSSPMSAIKLRGANAQCESETPPRRNLIIPLTK